MGLFGYFFTLLHLFLPLSGRRSDKDWNTVSKGGGGGGGSGGAKVLGKLPVPGRSTNLDYGIVLAVGAGGGCLDIFFSHLSLSFLSPSL